MFDHAAFQDHEQVVFAHDRASGLRAIVALHSTRLGPAFGGIRMRAYDCVDAALGDVLRLSAAMTLKAAITDVPLGGGKAVILGDPKHDKSEALVLAMARVIEDLGGRYRGAEDVGTDLRDLATMRRVTRHVLELGTLPLRPAPSTAHGVFVAIRAAIRHRLGREDAGDLRVSIQGLGKVGAELARMLAHTGARLAITDLDPARVAEIAAETGAEAVTPDRILARKTDVLAPCALGAVLDARTVESIDAGIVCGAANNQLADPACGRRLHARGILYVPDFVANAGGVIDATHDGPDYDPERALADVGRIETIVERLLEAAAAENLPPEEVALRMARARLAAAPREHTV